MAADLVQLGELLAQSRAAAASGVAAGDLTVSEQALVDRRVSRGLDRLARGKLPRLKGLCEVAERATAL